MPTLRTSRRSAKPERILRILSRDASGLTVRITVGKEASLYRVEPLAADFGIAFAVSKLAQADDLGIEYEPPYHVNLCLENASRSTCECKGFLRHAHCKHRDGLLKLKSLGKV